MIDLENLEDIGRKLWAKKKYDEYEKSEVKKSIDRSLKSYTDPTSEDYKERVDKSKWKTTVDKKVNYLLSRKPVCEGYQEELDELLSLIKETAKQYLLRGSVIWLVQGDGEDIDPKPYILDNCIAIYKDENKEEPIAYIRKYKDTTVDAKTGNEETLEMYEIYYGEEFMFRDTYCYTLDTKDRVKEKVEPYFIEIGRTGDAPLFAYVEGLLDAFNKILKHQDTAVEKNTTPLTEVRGYSGTSDEDLKYSLETLNIARTDGNGGVTIHARSMDSAAIDLWAKRLMNEYYEATCTVGKDNELAYAQSGKAMDRLFIDVESSAKELGQLLEVALVDYFQHIGITKIDVVWNTDRPVDDVGTISGIQASVGILSRKTLLEQHPWVDDVDEEIKRIEEEEVSGMEDLVDTTSTPNEEDNLFDDYI